MESNRKEIRFYGMKPTKPLLSMIERQIEKWAFRQIPPPLCPEASYRISIEREGKCCLCCHLQVEAGTERWESVDVGRCAQDALFNALSIWRDTWSPISEFRREFDRLFDDWTPPSRGLRTESTFAPACDVDEAEDHFLLSLEMAGVKKEDVKIEVMDNQLFISGERKTEALTQPGGPIYRERRLGKFSRSFALPAGLDAEKVEANYQDGILRVLVPKAESAKPRQIQITNGNGASKFFGKLLNRTKEKEEMLSTNEHRRQSVAS